MRLLIVEDETKLADLLRAALDRAGFSCDVAPDLADADSCVRGVNYDAIVLDLGLPDGNGLDWLRRLRRRCVTAPVLILTARDALEDRVRGLDSGADDYLVKPFHVTELAARLRALLRRPNAALGMRLEIGNVVFDTVSRNVEVNGANVASTARELSLLELLMRRAGSVVSREHLEQGLYAFDAPTAPNAVEVAVHRLRRHLQAVGASVQVHTVRGVGYMLAAE